MTLLGVSSGRAVSCRDTIKCPRQGDSVIFWAVVAVVDCSVAGA